jgi:uncharacterized protein YndB with AHSA1/START domain
MALQILHRTLVFERRFPADVERVFAALADPVQRALWSAPSDGAAFVYDEADFRQGGRDIFRCGDKAAPQFTGVTTYIAIAPPIRIVSNEVVESGGAVLMASLLTTELEAQGPETDLRLTVQMVSFHGEEMVRGVEAGNAAALDNLALHLAG